MQVYTPEMEALSKALPMLEVGGFYTIDADKINSEQAKLVAMNVQYKLMNHGFNTMVSEGKRIVMRVK